MKKFPDKPEREQKKTPSAEVRAPSNEHEGQLLEDRIIRKLRFHTSLLLQYLKPKEGKRTASNRLSPEFIEKKFRELVQAVIGVETFNADFSRDLEKENRKGQDIGKLIDETAQAVALKIYLSLFKHVNGAKPDKAELDEAGTMMMQISDEEVGLPSDDMIEPVRPEERSGDEMLD